MARPVILVVDDDDSVRSYLSVLLSSRGYEVSEAPSADEALARLAAGPLLPAVMLLDLVMPGMSGLDLLAHVKQSHPQVPVVILSTVGQIKTVVEAMNRGAADYLTKPFQEPELELTIENVLEKQRLKDEVTVLRRRLDQFTEPADFLSSNPRIARIREIARQVAETDAPVLLLGETGVGKEVLARYVHAHSPRRDRPFVRVNCAALPHDLLESELFGYERGAFSGALRDKPGKFEMAHRGTILLDEIAEMSPHLQAKLLHVLQDGEFSRLGARQPTRVDARVLASTNRSMEKAVADGTFREDLYFRLNVIRLEIPPLRERPEDVPLLAACFIQRYAERDGAVGRSLPPEILDAFQRHDWPGNVRELENAVRRYLIVPDLEMALADLGRGRRPEATAPASAPQPTAAPAPSDLKKLAAEAADQAEREAVRRVLTETRWNRRQAALRLNISYKALLNKLKKWEGQEGDFSRVSPGEVPHKRRRDP
ncbi:MAG: sigma-54-dependent Fis family transcriptional regulator [Acidobacteria bacterium]|nr:sigma-54-dependent Fis family transcriptional regulator [Acidobacteriota bacterium]